MEKQLVRLLIVDDSPDDVELITDILRKAGYMLKTQRVQDAAGMQAELQKTQWDAIVCELHLAHFNTQLALDMLKRAQLDIPFIVMARSINEDEGVTLMRAGAHDVISKASGGRLAAVLARELKALQQRQQFQRAETALAEIEGKHRSLIETSREAICYAQDGMHIDANRAYLNLFGYEHAQELEGVPFLNLVDKADHAKVKDFLRKHGSKGSTDLLSFSAINNQGGRFFAEIGVSPLTIKGEACQQILISDISKRRAAEQKLQYLNQHDALTGLHNRHHFLQELAKAVERAQSSKRAGALLYIDIDQLQAINDEFGLEVGDRLLLRLAKLFREKLRPQDVLARLSGDEFGALLADADRSHAEAAAAAINEALKAAPLDEGGKKRECQCTVSVIEIEAGTTPQKVLMQAHQAQREAKGHAQPATKLTRSAAASKPADTGENAGQYGEWHRRIEAALAQGKFHPVFQPIVNLHAEASENYEVLVRMSEDNAVLSAGEFMSAADESGQAREIDRAILKQVITHMAQVHKAGRQTRFFLNVSAWTLRDQDYVPFLLDSLKEAGVQGRFLVFEIEESAIANFPAAVTQFVQATKRLGCELAVDNFTLASLHYIRQQPFSFLKLSSALMQNLDSDEINQALMQTVSKVAKSLDKRTIAKHVESAESLTVLWTYEIDYVQGHYFQAPHPQLEYDFNIESLSSDHAVAGWISR